MLNCGDCLGTLAVDGHPTTDPAGRWCAYDLRKIRAGRNNRGTDTPLPHVADIIGNPRRFAATPLMLPFAIDGTVDPGGYDVGRDGAEDRVSTYVLAARALYIGTNRTFVFTQPSGHTWTSVGHIEDLDGIDDEGIWNGNLELTLLQDWEITP